VRTYEVLFIVAPTENDEAVDGLVEHIRGVATERGATVAKVDRMGRRRLAYPIRQSHTSFNDGTYVVMTVEGAGSEIAEIERRLRVAESVIRYITIRVDEDIKRAEKFKAKRQAKGRTGGPGGRRRGGAADNEVFTETTEDESGPEAQEEVV
jgi:small subunit ribosomal protein S6